MWSSTRVELPLELDTSSTSGGFFAKAFRAENGVFTQMGDENNNGDNTVHFEESITRHVMCCLESVNGVYKGDDGKGILALNDPDRIDRPPGLEEDEVEKPIPIRKEEEGDKGKKEENSEGR